MSFKKPGVIAIFLAASAVFMVFLAPKVVHLQKLKSRSENLEEEIKGIQKGNLQLEARLRLLREDPVYLEKVAREKLSKAKQGEIVYNIIRQAEVEGKR